MNKLAWLFSFLVLIGSGLFVHHYAYGDSMDYLRPTVGMIEFTGGPDLEWYQITSKPVQQLGEPLGAIASPFRHTINGTFSNVLPPGSKLYGIKGVNWSDAIAVPWRGKYVEAVRVSS